MIDPRITGDISEAFVFAKFVQKEWTVLKPFQGRRYDFVIDRNGKFERIQVKTGRISNGALEFPVCSSKKDRPSYKGQIEFFGVYCPDNNRVYLVPINICGKSACTLRLYAPKNHQKQNINWATDFEI